MSKRYGFAVVILLLVEQWRVRRRHVDQRVNKDQRTDSYRKKSLNTLEPLTNEVLVRRSLEVFPAGYFTSISVIQGVALAALGTNLVIILRDPMNADFRVEITARTVIVLFGIIFVSYEYFWFTSVMRWPATVRDTMVPYLLGISEIIPALVLGSQRGWWLSFVLFTIVGSVALLNSVSRLHIDSFEGDVLSFKLTWRVLSRSALLVLGGGLVSAIAYFVTPELARGLQFSILGYVAVGGLLGSLFAINESDLNRLFSHQGVPRKPARIYVRNLLRPRVDDSVFPLSYEEPGAHIKVFRRTPRI